MKIKNGSEEKKTADARILEPVTCGPVVVVKIETDPNSGEILRSAARAPFRVDWDGNGRVNVLGNICGRFEIVLNGCLEVCREGRKDEPMHRFPIPGLRAFCQALSPTRELSDMRKLKIRAISGLPKPEDLATPNFSPPLNREIIGGLQLAISTFDIIWNANEGRVVVR